MREERLADTAECPGSCDDNDNGHDDDHHGDEDDNVFITSGKSRTISVTALTMRSEHGMNESNWKQIFRRNLKWFQFDFGFVGTFSSLALMRSSWMHLVIASVLLTTSS